MSKELINPSALFSIGYGLYAVTVHDGKKDNALIVNTVTQLTSSPLMVAVTVNKANYSYGVIAETGKMNVNCITESAPFSMFQHYGFQSGANTDKLSGISFTRSENGLAVLTNHVNACISLEVEQEIDLGTHGMFLCTVTEATVLSDEATMTYDYYHKNVKPKPETTKKKGYICKICGYVYEGEVLPPDYICPLCKHGAEDFEEIK